MEKCTLSIYPMNIGNTDILRKYHELFSLTVNPRILVHRLKIVRQYNLYCLIH